MLFGMTPEKKSKGEKQSATEKSLKSIEKHFSVIEEQIEHGFTRMHARMDDEFEQVSARFEKVERGVRALQTGQDNLYERVEEIHRRTVNLELRVEDVRDTLADIVGAEEKDAEATINHEFRIAHLERLGGIMSAPPPHLVGLE